MLRKTRKMQEAEESLARQDIHQPLDQYITAQLNAGARFSTLAKALGVSNGSLSYWIAKMGIQKQYGQGKVDEQQKQR